MDIIESGLSFKQLNYGLIPIMLVLHHAESVKCTIQDIHKWHLENGWSGCGYHYFVDKDGLIFRGRPENAIGSHCLGANDKSIGICAEGSYMIEDMKDVQNKAIVELSKDICNRHGIKQVYGHRELKSTNCPGTNYPLEEIRQAIFKPTIIERIDNMTIGELQIFLNATCVRDYEDKELVVDGINGKRTESAKEKAKEILKYILE